MYRGVPFSKSGAAERKRATTHWASIEQMKKDFPEVSVQQNIKFVDEGNIITSGGISAGINMSFHIVKRLLGEKTTKETARRMEYDIEI